MATTEIKVKWVDDTGPCDVTCDTPNTNGVQIEIGGDHTNKEAENQGTHLFLCDKHAKELAFKLLKVYLI